MMNPKAGSYHIFFLLFLACVSLTASAADGRIEINQASVEAAGGFPYTISDAGSYVLTSSLTVPADTSGIIVAADNVTLDLNGFMISGPYQCEPGNCPGGSADGITTNGQSISYVTVRNGIVSGFSDRCIQLFQHARVEHMQITQCGRDGINLSAYGSVFFNQVFRVGDIGIFMAGTSGVLGHNTVSEVSFSPSTDPAIQGGKQTAGNYCDDGACGWVDTRRRYYLTVSGILGNQALAACANGFHMAALWEILELSQLRYDAALGVTQDDQGEGPPTAIVGGWVRTGNESGTEEIPGRANCDTWSSGSGTDHGTVAYLPGDWTMPQHLDTWLTSTTFCNNTAIGVWCLEN